MTYGREEMLERMLASDPAADGRFLTGVLSTGIYCLPSCRARKPKPENVRFFDRPESAESAGLRPCKRCRPDLYYRGRDPDREQLEAAVARLRQDPGSWRDTRQLASAVGVGWSKLGELCRRHYHATPGELLARARIDRARRLLLESDRPVTEVGFEVGFESLSAFHDRFRRLCATSPGDYRRLRGADAFEVVLPSWLRRDAVLAHLGRDPESRGERVRGRRAVVGLLAAGVPVAATVELAGRSARCRLESPRTLPPEAAADVHGQLLRLLGLAVDPRGFERRSAREPEVARLIGGRRGLSIPQTATPFDGFLWVIVGQQVSLPVAFSLRRRLYEHAGERLGEGLYAPPTPASIAGVEESELRALGLSRRKAEYLSGVARSAVAGELDPDALATLSATELEGRLRAVRGFGPWSVDYLRMRAYALVDCVPVGDAGLRRNLKRFCDLERRPDDGETRRLMAPFAPHRSLATFHLWALEEDDP